MISDVLSDALAQIERYQTDPVFAHRYNEPRLVAQMDAVKRATRDLLRALDTPPRLDVEERVPAMVPTAGPSEVPNLDWTGTILNQTYGDIDGMAGEVRDYVEDRLATIPSARRREAWKALAHALDEARIAVLVARGAARSPPGSRSRRRRGASVMPAIPYFDVQITPRAHSKNFVAAHNAGVAPAWLIPKVARQLSPALAPG